MLLSCCLVEIFGQQEGRKNNQEDIFEESCRGNKESRLSEGSCKNVIKVLRAALENDSLAIETFKKEYESYPCWYSLRCIHQSGRCMGLLDVIPSG